MGMMKEKLEVIRRKAEFEYDFVANAGYVALKKIEPGGVSTSREATNAEVILDFDLDGKLVGFEVLYLGIQKSEISTSLGGYTYGI